ncbi:MAG: 50S ribosomal protein L7/L12 [Eubacteriales bacterium]|nr:50S ribosomal protein L7/L12 [Eubacteriales bacterium]
MDEKFEKIIEEIKGMTVLELNELVKAMEETFGVSAAAPVAAAGPAADAAPVEEKTEWNVVLTDAGPEKLKVVKAVREATGLALKDAKALVDGAPSTLKEGVSKEEADAIVAKVAEVGGKCELK